MNIKKNGLKNVDLSYWQIKCAEIAGQNPIYVLLEQKREERNFLLVIPNKFSTEKLMNQPSYAKIVSKNITEKLKDKKQLHTAILKMTYITWRSMVDRCYNMSKDNYKWYGARGIEVCERWHKYENFLAEMGDRPEGKTLDRIDPYKNYELENCRWATPAEQGRNKRKKATV